MEIEELNVNLSEKNLAKLIKSNKKFNDDDNKFSRLKYEKFLLEQNISAYEFEKRFKNNELKNNLFNYISGGIKSPYFLKNKIFINETKKLEIETSVKGEIGTNTPMTLAILFAPKLYAPKAPAKRSAVLV